MIRIWNEVVEEGIAFPQEECLDMESGAAFLVGHHHTFAGIDGMDYQILVEADYIANATENGYSKENVSNFMAKIMKTQSGKRLLATVFDF